MGIAALVGAELGVIVFSGFGSGNEFSLLAQIVSAAHTNESPFFEVVFFLRTKGDRIDQNREVMRIAADDLNELILAFHQRLVVDATGVHLSETVFAALCNKTAPIASVFIVKLFLVFVPYRRAVDNHRSSLDCLLGLVSRRHPHLREFLPAVFI